MNLSNKIQLQIMAQCSAAGRDIVIPNCHLGWYEMDVCKIMPSGFVVEYEIKISRSDFKADFKKANKHKLLESGDGRPNRFYFVCPAGLISKYEIPKYAGLLTYDEKYNRLNTIKNAPCLHKRKYDKWYYVASLLNIRAIHARNDLRRAQAWNSELNKQLMDFNPNKL